MQRLIIVGSPRSGGRSAHLADALMEACIEECPDDGLAVLSVGALDVDGCIGCDGCRPIEGDEAAVDGVDGSDAEDDADADADLDLDADVASDALSCVIDDDMAFVRRHLDACDELIIVTPVYFSGVPSQLKAWLDRLQPYFWTDRRHGDLRPTTIHIVGEGADPFGFSGVISTVSSAILCAGFKVERVLSWVGRIDEDGEILADADEIAIDEPARA